MLDILVTGGDVALPAGVTKVDLGINGGKIVGLYASGAASVDAIETVDAEGKLVLPGGIDPHVHCDWVAEPAGPIARSGAGPDVVSRAALHGGTTTLIDFAFAKPGGSLAEAAKRQDQHWATTSYTDYSHHLRVDGGASDRTLAEIPDLLSDGYSSIKVYTSNVRPNRQGRKIGFGVLRDIMRIASTHGGLIAVHSEDEDIVMHDYDDLFRRQQTSFVYSHLAHSNLSELLSFNRVVKLAEYLGGVPTYFMHVSAREGVQVVEEARAKGLPIFAETLPQYAMHTFEDYLLENGQIFHTYPSLKSADDVKTLWHGLLNGAISTVATDCVCTDLETKISEDRIDTVVGGNVGVETRLPIMYTEAVVRRGMPIERFVDIFSTNAAKIFGMYPTKGAILPGSDADLVIVDPAAEWTLTSDALHESDYTPWQGVRVCARPVMTLSRGRVAVRDGDFLLTVPDGRRVSRRLNRNVMP